MFHAWIIFGPTASGKTDLALRLAKEKGADILSFDARQLYQGMAIGTGQDLPADYLRGDDGSFRSIADPHAPVLFGFDLVTPNQPFSIRHYYDYCRPVIESHRQNQKPLVLVGGSWPYARVVIDPPESLLAPTDPSLRQTLANLKVAALQARLNQLDPGKFAALNSSDRANPRRLVRAIEAAANPAGERVPPLLQPNEYSVLLRPIALSDLEPKLRARIQSRLSAGVLDETKQLISAYPDWSAPAFSAAGYQFLRSYLEGEIPLDQAKELWFRQERQYAKRQLTWLKKINQQQRYNVATL